MNKFDDGIEIYSIDKDQTKMTINLGDIANLHKEYRKLKEENEKLKKMHTHLHKYASDMESKYLIAKGVTDWLKIWLKEEIERISKIAYKSKLKPYGEELHLHENAINRYKQVLEKIEELEREFYESN